MPVEIINASGKLLQLKVRGMLKKADHERIIQIAKAAIAREGKIKALIVAEDFEGWERHEDWGDVSFMMEEGQHIEKMAIVGDEKWKDDALAFTAKGFRPTAIEFFPVSPERSAYMGDGVEDRSKVRSQIRSFCASFLQ